MSQGKDVQIQLALLIEEAEEIDENLMQRLAEIYQWIKDLKQGQIQAKRLLLAFLIQLIEDAETYLNIQENEVCLEEQTAVEQYWYGTLFPRWLKQPDPKFEYWKPKLKREDLPQDDKLLKQMAYCINQKPDGQTWRSFIADFSMATDLIVSYHQQKSLCIQLTTLSEEHQGEKYQEWQKTLQYWQIPRGLFLSYNPSKTDAVNRLVNTVFMNSDSCKDGQYKRFDA